MSVLKNERKGSRNDAYHLLNVIRKELTDCVLTDFGCHDYKKISDSEWRAENISVQNYESHKIYVRVTWFIPEQRKVILDTIRDIQKCIILADHIHITSHEEFIERRTLWNKAIGLCFILINELQNVIETLPVNVNRYLQLTDKLSEEIKLLKTLRKEDNRFKKTGLS